MRISDWSSDVCSSDLNDGAADARFQEPDHLKEGPMSELPILSLRGVTKSYTGRTGATTEVLAGIDFDVREGEFIAILGFSGAGKTTLISAIAGLVMPDAGQILLRGKAVNGPDKERGLVFQSYSLFPWLTVEQNVALAVEIGRAHV